MVAAAQEIVQANVVVLPDALEDSRGTLDIACQGLAQWSQTITNAELMFVPQGETLHSWIWCLEQFIEYATNECGIEPQWIGIPRNTTGRIVNSRRQLVEIVEMLLPYADIHLLGFSDNLADDMISARHEAVSSIDSAVPFRSGPIQLTKSIPKRGAWWDMAKNQSPDAIPEWAVDNIHTLNDWASK
jgi:hypothetical protein